VADLTVLLSVVFGSISVVILAYTLAGPLVTKGRMAEPGRDCGNTAKVNPGKPIKWCPECHGWEYDERPRQAPRVMLPGATLRIYHIPPGHPITPTESDLAAAEWAMTVGKQAAEQATAWVPHPQFELVKAKPPDCAECDWEEIHVVEQEDPVAYVRSVPCPAHR
jgi:hypothetical protein